MRRRRSGAGGRLGDLGYELGYRVQRTLYGVFGPPQLNADDDPIRRLERQRQERAARRRSGSG